jgi:hypothetical protein
MALLKTMGQTCSEIVWSIQCHSGTTWRKRQRWKSISGSGEDSAKSPCRLVKGQTAAHRTRTKQTIKNSAANYEIGSKTALYNAAKIQFERADKNDTFFFIINPCSFLMSYLREQVILLPVLGLHIRLRGNARVT